MVSSCTICPLLSLCSMNYICIESLLKVYIFLYFPLILAPWQISFVLIKVPSEFYLEKLLLLNCHAMGPTAFVGFIASKLQILSQEICPRVFFPGAQVAERHVSRQPSS